MTILILIAAGLLVGFALGALAMALAAVAGRPTPPIDPEWRDGTE